MTKKRPSTQVDNLPDISDRVAIWWEGDQRYYEANVLRRDDDAGTHCIKYLDDGMEEEVKLANERWVPLEHSDDSSTDDGQSSGTASASFSASGLASGSTCSSPPSPPPPEKPKSESAKLQETTEALWLVAVGEAAHSVFILCREHFAREEEEADPDAVFVVDDDGGSVGHVSRKVQELKGLAMDYHMLVNKDKVTKVELMTRANNARRRVRILISQLPDTPQPDTAEVRETLQNIRKELDDIRCEDPEYCCSVQAAQAAQGERQARLIVSLSVQHALLAEVSRTHQDARALCARIIDVAAERVDTFTSDGEALEALRNDSAYNPSAQLQWQVAPTELHLRRARRNFIAVSPERWSIVRRAHVRLAAVLTKAYKETPMDKDVNAVGYALQVLLDAQHITSGRHRMASIL